MRAMILAAGKGERMRPLTDKTPKPLLVVDGRPLLMHHLQALSMAGIKQVVINTWYLADQIKAALNNSENFGLQITCIHEPELLNTGGGIVNALPFLGAEPFLVISADVLSDFPLQNLPKNPDGLAHLIMVDNPDYHREGDFGLEHGIISRQAIKKLTYANIGVFRPEFFVSAPQGAFPLGVLLREHIANNLISGEYYAGNWHNIGTPQDLELVNNII